MTPETHLHPVQLQHPTPEAYIAATSIDHALALLGAAPDGSTRLIAGGSDLLLEIERGVRRGITTLVDISRVSGANAITVHETSGAAVAHLGPMVTHGDVTSSSILVERALPLAQACYEVASPQLRNRATVVGNIVTASPANDTISALLALGASVTLTSIRGSRTLAVEEFITGFRTTQLAADEMITDVAVPLLDDRSRGIFVKLGNRSAQAISVVHAALVVRFGADRTTVESARLALGSVAASVVLVADAAQALVGRQLDETTIGTAARLAAAAVSPIGDVRATAQYRTDTIEVVVSRALRTIAADRQRERWPALTPRLNSAAAESIAPSDRITAADAIVSTVNGRRVSAAGAAGSTLLDWLRDQLGLTGTKEGCAEGECGACTVLLDGAAVMSCLVPAGRAAGATVTTVEGLADGAGQHPLQTAFVACGAVQCGYCTPGFVVAGAALLAECPNPTGAQICQGLSGNLCRCTGYKSIIAAVELAATSGLDTAATTTQEAQR
jgi:carbon-monoxide dehydrogenase medium subunit